VGGIQLIGRYRLVAPLASGGMGTVWRAHDLTLDRPVAVKEVLLPPGLDEEAREVLRRRTLREARAAAQLRHPAIVTVYDVVEHDGRPWIVMELVPSQSLEQVIRTSGGLPPAEVAGIGLRILDALVTAHAAGVQHRDVKPANVLLADDGRVVLTDFGIARHVGDETLTTAGLLVGSPNYLAPERARGHTLPGLASDLWSLGATMYTAVEGHPPFERNGPLPTLAAVVMDEPEPPRKAGLLRPVIDGLLVKEPAYRLDADTTRRMLQGALRGRPVTAPGTVPLPRGPEQEPERAVPVEPARTLEVPPTHAPAGTPPAAVPPAVAASYAAAPPDTAAVDDEAATAEPPPPVRTTASEESPDAETATARRGAASAVAGAAVAAVAGDQVVVRPQEAARSEEAVVSPRQTAAPAEGSVLPQQATRPEETSAAPQQATRPDETSAAPQQATRAEEVGVRREDAARPRPAPEGGATSADVAAIASEPDAAEAARLRTEAPQTIEPATLESRAAAPTAAGPASPAAEVAARKTTIRPAPIRPAPIRPAPPRDAEPTALPPRRRGRAVAAAVALLAAASAAAILLPRAFDDPERAAAPTTAPASPTGAPAASGAPGTSQANGGSPPPASPTAGASATTATTARATATPGATRPTIPAGFTRYTDPRDGFSLAVPAGWRPSRNGTLVDFDDPTSGRFLRIDTSDSPQADPYDNWVSYERQFSRTHTGYTNLGIRRVNYGQDRGWETADWEFRLGSTHVLDRNILISPRRAHAIYWSTPESLWGTPESRRIFNTAAATFEPAPVD